MAGARPFRVPSRPHRAEVRQRARAPEGPTVSVVIPATNRPETLDRCLDAIGHASDPPEEIIVVEDPAGAGPAAARNSGALRATGSVLVFVDSDVLVHPNAFTRIRAAFREDPQLCAVFGSYDNLPSAHGVVSTFRNTLHHYVHQSAAGVATTFWAGLGAVRREAFMAVDGFDDERFRRPCVEDIELGLRLNAAGGLIRLDPQILGTHLKRWSLVNMMATDLLHRGTPWTAIMLTYGPTAARLNVRGTHLFAVAALSTGLAATGLGRRRFGASMFAGYLTLNSRFYRLMLRTSGARGAAAAVALLATHNVTALGSIPLGIVRFGLERANPPAGRRLPMGPHRDGASHAAAREDSRSGRFRRRGVPGPPVIARTPAHAA